MATADALISSWDSKVHYAFWRPVTAIVEADNDGNPQTAADASWQPLINNPNYPDYTSGANNVAGAMTRTLRVVLRDQPHDVRRYDCRIRKPCARRERIAASRTPQTTWSRRACFSASTFGSRMSRGARRDDR